MRLIDADELLKNEFKNDISFNAFQNLVKRQKTIDAVPVVHGEWYRPKEWSAKTYRRLCTNCQDVSYFCGNGNYNFCPNCGAKMRNPCADCQEFDCYGC